MTVGEILEYINELAPWEYAESWDNVGLMLGSRQSRVNRILLSMDVTSKVIKEAVDCGAELIVSHHPFFFGKLNRLDFDTMKGRQVQTLVTRNISVISAHTNLDVAAGGVNDTLAETLGLVDLKPLKAYSPPGSNMELGLGKVGALELETEFNSFLTSVKTGLNIGSLRIIGAQPEKVQKVGVFCGSFDVELEYLKGLGLDAVITGDIKYHTASDAREMGICILDVGHFSSEHVILEELRKKLSGRFEAVEVVCSKMESDPFIFA